MNEAEPKKCWEYWNCAMEVRKLCPAFTSDSGEECWFVAGSFNAHPSCPKVKNNIMDCQQCQWFKKLNPDYIADTQ